MKKFGWLFALLAMIAGGSFCRASPSLDFGIQAGSPQAGTVSYDGSGGPLKGLGIDVFTVSGLGGTPLNNGVTRNLYGAGGIDTAVMDFMTGNLTGTDSNHWFFGAGGSITIVGGVDLDNNGSISGSDIPLGTTLLSGAFSNAQVVHTGVGIEVDISVVVNTVDASLASFYGLPGGPTTPYQGTLNLSFMVPSNVAPPGGFTSSAIGSGDLITTPVPAPTNLVLLCSGAVCAIGGCAWRRRKMEFCGAVA
jgi:hypothetical protein